MLRGGPDSHLPEVPPDLTREEGRQHSVCMTWMFGNFYNGADGKEEEWPFV